MMVRMTMMVMVKIIQMGKYYISECDLWFLGKSNDNDGGNIGDGADGNDGGNIGDGVHDNDGGKSMLCC